MTRDGLSMMPMCSVDSLALLQQVHTYSIYSNLLHALLVLIFQYLGAQIFSNAYFGSGMGPIAFRDLSCFGTENSILDCSYSMDAGTCTHADDAGVICQESKLISQPITIILTGFLSHSLYGG